MTQDTPLYACPMHPEIFSNAPGYCKICGMALVQKALSWPAPIIAGEHISPKKAGWKSYAPLLIVIGMILVATAAISARHAAMGTFSAEGSISYFMIGFFLVFAMFKLVDLKGFAHGYGTYDLLAKRVPAYGYAYPFIEVFFGIAMILAPLSRPLLIAEVAVMAFSGLGVAIKIMKKEEFTCACLGTFLKVPLTKVTLIEDFGMAGLALAMLLLTK